VSAVQSADAGAVASGRSLTDVSALAGVLGSGPGFDAPVWRSSLQQLER